MRTSVAIAVALCLLWSPHAGAHGALALNEFDVYAISDFEGQEESFAWEGWEIWDIYAGDGYNMALGSHGVYFKGNFAGDGTLRPTGSQVWELQFDWRVGDESFSRVISHDGTDVETDFEALEWQVADGNVFQIHAWAAVPAWNGLAIEGIHVLSLVDDNPRDVAPGGIYDPATGTEIPVNVPATPVFPEMGEGRIVDAVALTGSAKFLNVSATASADTVTFGVTNPLAAQGQHLMVHVNATPAWNIEGIPNPSSLEGGATTSFQLRFMPVQGALVVEPVRIDLMTDIGGKQSYWAYFDGIQVLLSADPMQASTFQQAPAAVESPAPGILGLLAVAMVAAVLRTRRS